MLSFFGNLLFICLLLCCFNHLKHLYLISSFLYSVIGCINFLFCCFCWSPMWQIISSSNLYFWITYLFSLVVLPPHSIPSVNESTCPFDFGSVSTAVCYISSCQNSGVCNGLSVLFALFSSLVTLVLVSKKFWPNTRMAHARFLISHSRFLFFSKSKGRIQGLLLLFCTSRFFFFLLAWILQSCMVLDLFVALKIPGFLQP